MTAHAARAIHDAGGTCWAQDPQTAFAPAMPRAAIERGAVQHVLTLDDMAVRLQRIVCKE